MARRLLLSATASAALLLSSGTAGAAPTVLQAAATTIDIPAQDLGQALRRLSQATGVQAAFDPELTRGRISAAVAGRMTPAEAARRMAAGTGLRVVEAGGVLTLARAAPQEEAPPPPPPEVFQVEDVVVAGFAAGLRRSLQAKRDGLAIADVVSADDMGQLPTNNMAESLARLPGVNAVRNHTTGEGDRITVRGLPTELNTYSLNGMRLGGTGSPEDNFYRGVRLSFLPPEGVAAITVSKSLTPDRDGDALGGAIDIRTPTAFDHEARHALVSASLGRMDKFGHRPSAELSASLGRRFDDRWGIFVTGGWSRRQSQFEQNGVDGDNQPPVWYADSETLGWDASSFVMRGMDLAFGETEVERFGLNASLDYRGQDHDFHVRGQFNTYRQDEFLNRLNLRNDTARDSTRLTQVDRQAADLAQPADMIVGFDDTLGRIYGYTPAQIVDRDGDGRITDRDRGARGYYSLDGASGRWDPRGFRLRRFWEGSRETGALSSLNLGGVSRRGDWTLDYDIAWSKSEDRIDDAYELEFRSDKYGWLGNAGVEISGAGDSRFPIWLLNPAGLEGMQDPSQYDFARLSGEVSGAREILGQGQFNLEWRAASPWLESVRGGMKYFSSRRRTHGGVFLDLDAAGTMADFAPFFGRPVEALFGARYAGPYRLGVVLDHDAMLAELARAERGESEVFHGFAVPPAQAALRDAESFRFRENVIAGYLMATARLGSSRLVGGVRVERTGNTIHAYDPDPIRGGGRFTTDESAFVNVLPSLHLKYPLGNDTVVRAAVWSSFARPDIARMSSARVYRYDVDPDRDGVADAPNAWRLLAVEQGNPDLKPTRAVNYDLSIERYVGRQGAYSLAVFYKDIDNFLFRSSTRNIRDGTLEQTLTADGVIVRTPGDGGRAEVRGVEFSAQQVFHWLPAPLDGLGASVNLTLQRSRAETGVAWHPPGYALPLMETPDAIANIQVFWARDGWEAHAAWSYQSKFLEGIQDFGNDPYEQAYGFVDLTVRRKIAGATASVQVQNLLDAHTYWYTAGSGREASRAFIKNGRSISLGLAYAF